MRKDTKTEEILSFAENGVHSVRNVRNNGFDVLARVLRPFRHEKGFLSQSDEVFDARDEHSNNSFNSRIDFSGWRPIGHNADLQAQESSAEPSLDKQFLEVPVAVETDEEHVLSESELNQIREHVIHNWRQKPTKTESFPQMRPLVTQLLPKPEVELKAEEDDPK